MSEKGQPSVEELFRKGQPGLVKYLDEKDPFWEQIKNNTITETELIGHQRLLEELGQTPESSDVLKAIYEIKKLRQTVLPTPVEFYLGDPPRH
jgi:hypothetical protein